MKISLPPETPRWMVNVAKQIEQGFADAYPKSPVRLPQYESTDLPDPAKYPFSLIWITNLGTVAVSDGVDWFPVTLGAAI